MSRRCRPVGVAGVSALTRGANEEATRPGSNVTSKSGLSVAGYRTMAGWESGDAPRRRKRGEPLEARGFARTWYCVGEGIVV